MQIQKVKFSNILSFPYLEDFDANQWIIFDTEKNWSVNILIWPNWAWKSNFLLIINEIIKSWLMKDYVYDPKIINSWENNKFSSVITENEVSIKKIFKHFWNEDKKSKVSIAFKLNNHDIENLWFMSKHRDHFQKLIRKYSNIKLNLSDINTESLLENRILEVTFDIDIENRKAIIDESYLSKHQRQIVEYIKNIELMQIWIIIQNEFEYPNDKIKFYPLKNTFTSIWLHRNFFELSTNIDPKWRNTYISEKNTIEYPPFIWYYLCINKIRNIINNTSNENIDTKSVKREYTLEDINKKLNKSDFFSNLKEVILKYFNKELQVWKDNNWFYLFLVDSFGQKFSFEQLSDWEQSMLTIIFALYWFDLKEWTMLIDEPEIHTHPQMQRSIVRMLEKVSENIWTQFIISTYSPLFINEWNISNVYRFTKINWETKIIYPQNIGTEERSLIQMLKFENASKIFFSNKIIMVEWETDAYFFEFYLNYLHKNFPLRKKKLKDYEIININWKWWFKRRRHFLSKFWIKSYFIWDRDNTVDFGILHQMDLNNFYQKSKKYYNTMKKEKKSYDRHYTKLVKTVKDLYPNKHSYIIEKIEELYEENVFILEKWDIETYLWMKSKWLEDTVNFCHRHFHQRIKNKSLQWHIKELDKIMNIIFP